MKKILIACATAAGLCLVASGAQADRGGGGHGGGGFHGGGGGHSFHGGNFHGGHFHGGHFHGRGFGGSVFIGAPLFWPYYGYPYYYDYPAYSYDDYPAYSYYDYPTGGYAQPAPAQPQTQFYCPNSGYYPTVKACPQGWLRVVPDNAPPQY